MFSGVIFYLKLEPGKLFCQVAFQTETLGG